MKAKLTRAMLWDDKKSLDEILKVFPGEFLYGMYLDSTVRAHPRGDFQLDALKVLNEVFYMCTRVVYEEDANADTYMYMREIKADMGSASAAKLVVSLMDILLKAQGNKSYPVMKFLGKLAVNHIKRDDFLNLYTAALFSKNIEKFYLEPCPCKPKDLARKSIDWDNVTFGFTTDGIREVVKLWKNPKDQKSVLGLIKNAFNNRTYVLFPRKKTASIEDFEIWQKDLDDELKEKYKAEPLKISDEELSDILDSINQYQRLFHELQIGELEREVRELRAELNNIKTDENKEKTFSLSYIVDYCKNRADICQVKDVVSMLYYFLRNNSTIEEQQLVDDIEEYFKEKKYPKVDVNGPMYEISGNNNVNIGAENGKQ